MIGAFINKDGLQAELLMKGNANDSSGNGNDFTTTASLTTDKFGRSNRAYYVNHRDERLNINSNPIDYTNDWSVSIYGRQTVLNSTKHNFFITSRISDGRSFTLRKNVGTDDLRAYIWDGANLVDITATGVLSDTKFHHFVIQYKVSTKTLYLYMDSVLIGQDISGNPLTNNVQTGFMGLGGQSIQPSTVADTEIGQFYIFQRNLSPFEINQLYLNSQLLEN